MNKLLTTRKRRIQELKEDVYKEWKRYAKKHYTKTSAIPILSEIYQISESSVSKYILDMEREHGVRPHRERLESMHKQAFDSYSRMKEEGLTDDEAYHQIGDMLNKSFATIRNWVKYQKQQLR